MVFAVLWHVIGCRKREVHAYIRFLLFLTIACIKFAVKTKLNLMKNPFSLLPEMQFAYQAFRFLLLASAIFIALFMNTQTAAAQANNHTACGEESGWWNYDTVFVSCDVLVPQGETLSIAAGTLVLFEGHYGIAVHGVIQAEGLADSPVRFTINDTTGFADIHSTAGGWNGIRFDDILPETDSSFFSHVAFSYGKAVIDSVFRYGGAICIRNFNKIRISHCLFENNYAFYRGGAVYAEKADILVTHSHFEGNYAGNDSLVYGYGGALKFVTAEPDIAFCTFTNNASTGIGGAVSFEFSNPRMLNCIFTQNASALGGAIGYLRSTPNRVNANLQIVDNYALYFGGGIANVAASPLFSNITLSGNSSAMGGGLYCNEASSPKLFNSIIWGNYTPENPGSQVWLWDTESEPGFYNCIMQYGTAEFGGSGSMFDGPYVDCIEEDPMFTDVNQHDFSLLPESPGINAGMADTAGLSLPWFDLAMNHRISGGRIDMGVFEYQEGVFINETKPAELVLSVYPQPITASSRLSFYLPGPGKVSIQISDLNGRLVYEGRPFHLNAGTHVIHLTDLLPMSRLSGNVFVLHLQTEGGSQQIKMLK